MASSPLDQEASKNFLESTRRIWFDPEIERLKQIRSVKEDYQPETMQVILFPHNDKSVLFDGDVFSVQYLEANSRYKDCAHVTFEKDVNGNWLGYFDFRYNTGKASELLSSAHEFFESSKEAYKAGRLQVFADNLFSAAELFVQSLLFVESPNQRFVDDPTHKWTELEFSKYTKLGNIDPLYSKELGRLSKLRDEARYYKREFRLDDSTAKEHINIVEDLAKEVGRFIS